MPTVAAFNGIKIEMYGNEHPPPHFHARYAEHIAQVGIPNLEVIKGSLPPPLLRLVREWAASRTNALLLAWATVERNGYPEKIP